MEAAVINTVENNIYTKDLAICVTGNNSPKRDQYVNTADFIKKVK